MMAVVGWFLYGLAVIVFGVLSLLALGCIFSVFDQGYRAPGFRNNWDRWVGGFLLLLIVPTLIGFVAQL